MFGDPREKLADRCGTDHDFFRYGMADETFGLHEHLRCQEGIAAALEEVVVVRQGLGFEQPPPQSQKFSF